jgi:hypothetical protein
VECCYARGCRGEGVGDGRKHVSLFRKHNPFMQYLIHVLQTRDRREYWKCGVSKNTNSLFGISRSLTIGIHHYHSIVIMKLYHHVFNWS